MKNSIRSTVLTALALAGSVIAATPSAGGDSGKSKPSASLSKAPQKSSGSQLPGGTEHIPAGVGTATPPALANRTHHARRQDALQHAQTVINSREQLRSQGPANAATPP